MTDTLRSLIAKYDTGEAATTAEAVFEVTDVPVHLRDLFHPLVQAECRRHERAAARTLERAAASQESVDPHSPNAGSGTVSRLIRTDWIASRFCTGNGYVLAGEATIEDHRDRIKFLATMKVGIDKTIAIHEEAIHLITEAGVTCLNEIESAA